MEITSEFCRICLKYAPMFDDSNCLQSFSIYKKDHNNLTFADKIHILTIIKIPRSIPLAKRICTTCSEDLNSAFKLIKKCEESDLILQKFIQKNSDCNKFLQLKLNRINCEENDTENDLENYNNDSEGKTNLEYDRITSDCEKISVYYENSSLNESLSANCNNSSNDNVSPCQTSDFNENEIKNDLLMENLEDIKPVDKKCQFIRKRKCTYKNMPLVDESSITSDNDDDFEIDNESESSSDDWNSEIKKNENIKLSERKKIFKIVMNKNIPQNVIRLDNQNDIAKGNSPLPGLKRQKTFSSDQCHQNDRKEENSLSNRKAKIKKNKIIRLISTQERLKRNRKIVRLSEKNSIVCEICGKIYQRYDMLRGHMKWHENNDQDFVCDICGKNFELPDYLKGHRKIHFNRPCPFKCEICSAAFYHESKLKEHMKTRHSDERLKCPQCDITVKHRASLKRHIFKHTELKPFACIDCSKEFRNMPGLKQHLTSKFHASKEIQPMVRIKGVTQQYEPIVPKKRKLLVVDTN